MSTSKPVVTSKEVLVAPEELKRLQRIEREAKRIAKRLPADAAARAKEERGSGGQYFISHAEARDLLNALYPGEFKAI